MSTVHTASIIEGINKLEIALLNSYADWLAIPHWDTEPKALACKRVNSDYRALCSFVAANDWERPPCPPMPTNEQLKMEWLNAIQLWREEIIGRLIGRMAKTKGPEQDDSDFMPAYTCRNNRIESNRQLQRLLKSVSDDEKGIRRKYRGQHLFVHAGDWSRWNAEKGKQDSEAVDRMESAANAITAEIRAAKKKKPKKSSRLLPGLLTAVEKEIP